MAVTTSLLGVHCHILYTVVIRLTTRHGLQCGYSPDGGNHCCTAKYFCPVVSHVYQLRPQYVV